MNTMKFTGATLAGAMTVAGPIEAAHVPEEIKSNPHIEIEVFHPISTGRFQFVAVASGEAYSSGTPIWEVIETGSGMVVRPIR